MYEYKVVPAPKRGLKSKGIRGTEARFANALEQVMNEHAQSGWEYQRTDTLPAEEREGLMGRATVYQNLLIFRKLVENSALSDVVGAIEEEVPLLEDLKEEVEQPIEAPKPQEPELEARTADDVIQGEVVDPADPLTDFKSERV